MLVLLVFQEKVFIQSFWYPNFKKVFLTVSLSSSRNDNPIRIQLCHNFFFQISHQYSATALPFQTWFGPIFYVSMTSGIFLWLRCSRVFFQRNNGLQLLSFCKVRAISKQNEKFQSKHAQWSKLRTSDANQCLTVLPYTEFTLTHELKYFTIKSLFSQWWSLFQKSRSHILEKIFPHSI